MNKYESVIIVEPNLSKEHLKEVLESTKTKINEFSTKTEIKEIGTKKLAYEIRHNKEGYYVLFEFEIKRENKDAISEIQRFYRIKDEIMKFIIVKRD